MFTDGAQLSLPGIFAEEGAQRGGLPLPTRPGTRGGGQQPVFVRSGHSLVGERSLAALLRCPLGAQI